MITVKVFTNVFAQKNTLWDMELLLVWLPACHAGSSDGFESHISRKTMQDFPTFKKLKIRYYLCIVELKNNIFLCSSVGQNTCLSRMGSPVQVWSQKQIWAFSSVGQNTCLASRRSRVRFSQGPQEDIVDNLGSSPRRGGREIA